MTGSNTSEITIRNPLTRQITDFLISIGIAVHATDLPDDTFLPGISIKTGALYIDESKLKYPGDLLHEAGHLAVMSPEQRRNATGDLEPGEGIKPDSLEMGAIAWSYAALVHLGLNPAVVFHEEGYRGSSESFIENFTHGRGVGVPLLVWKGLTTNELFPKMDRWLTT